MIPTMIFTSSLLSFFLCASSASPTPFTAAAGSRGAVQPAAVIPDSLLTSLSADEREALEFLYAYLPTPDILDYDSSYHLTNIRSSLRARHEMPWGKSVPEREWRHFVLPVRVNNEHTDLSRPLFYESLKERVSKLPMKEAILEVNHWCHEHVSYQPSDGRTSAPEATMRNALGRCGEESTFTVAALRAVGIPARQVYTPRWAHTDDNHAWVEAWADGKWHFLGACEPEPDLDMAWFNEPASRGLLMTTTAIGDYDGPEEVISRSPLSTTINVTANYAPVSPKEVIVTDTEGNPIEGAHVQFCIYNYAEFYPLVTRLTDSRGHASLTAGEGTLLMRASDGKRFGMALSSSDTVPTLILDKTTDFRGSLDFDITPPPPSKSLPSASAEAIAVNNLRKAREDSLRHAYEAGFPTAEEAKSLCARLGLNDTVAAPLIIESRGNHQVIESFIASTPDSLRGKAVRLLATLSAKDLHDVTAEVLNDHLCTPESASGPLYDQFVLSPRIALEHLTPYKRFFRDAISKSDADHYRSDPHALAAALASRTLPDTLYNPQHLPLSPVSAWKYHTADEASLPLLFTAICRSLGIPARIEGVSGRTQFADSTGEWQDVAFHARPEKSTPARKYPLHLDYASAAGREPAYYTNFTISSLATEGSSLLEFDDFIPVSAINACGEMLNEGAYMLVTGQRLADGSVLARTTFFGLGENEKSPELSLRSDTSAIAVKGLFDSENLFLPLGQKEKASIVSMTGRGYFILGLIAPGHEPSAHALNDLGVAKERLEALGTPILLIFDNEQSAAHFRPADYASLPSTVIAGVDGGSIRTELCEEFGLPETSMPIFIIADTFNRVVYLREGYGIHLGENLADTLERLLK